MLDLLLYFLSFFEPLVNIVPKIHNFKILNVDISKEIYWILCLIYGCILGKVLNILIKKIIFYI